RIGADAVQISADRLTGAGREELERRTEAEIRPAADTVGNAVGIDKLLCRAARGIHQAESAGANQRVANGAVDRGVKLPVGVRKARARSGMAHQGEPRRTADRGGVAKVEASGRLRIELEASHVEHDLIAGGAGYRVGEREREIAPRAKVVVSVDRADLPVAVQHVAGLLNRRFAEVERLDGQVERTAAVPMHA